MSCMRLDSITSMSRFFSIPRSSFRTHSLHWPGLRKGFFTVSNL